MVMGRALVVTGALQPAARARCTGSPKLVILQKPENPPRGAGIDLRTAGGAIAAALFLSEFVGDTRWAHIDIAGVDYNEEPAPTAPKGFTGWGVRLLDEYLRRHYE